MDSFVAHRRLLLWLRTGGSSGANDNETAVIIDKDDLPPEQKKEVAKLIDLSSATMPYRSKYEVLAKMAKEIKAKAHRVERNQKEK